MISVTRRAPVRSCTTSVSISLSSRAMCSRRHDRTLRFGDGHHLRRPRDPQMPGPSRPGRFSAQGHECGSNGPIRSSYAALCGETVAGGRAAASEPFDQRAPRRCSTASRWTRAESVALGARGVQVVVLERRTVGEQLLVRLAVGEVGLLSSSTRAAVSASWTSGSAKRPRPISQRQVQLHVGAG